MTHSNNSEIMENHANKTCHGRWMSENYEPGLVSVIIPTHNRAEMLRRAIRSVLAQTWQDLEIIVVSDGSTDHTEDAVMSFKDPRIQLFKHKTARGASAARNTALRACRGEYIAFLDDDDEWLPQKLGVQVPVLAKSNEKVGLVYAWMKYFRDGNVIRVHAPKLRGDVFVEMLDKQAIGGCPTVIIKRKVLDIVKGFDESFPRGNDGDFFRRISKHYHVDFVPQFLAKVYTGHSDRIGVNSVKNLKNVAFELESRLEIFKDDFDKYAMQKVNVLAHLGATYLKIMQFRKAFVCFFKMFRCDTCLYHKVRNLYKWGKYFLTFPVRKFLAGK